MEETIDKRTKAYRDSMKAEPAGVAGEQTPAQADQPTTPPPPPAPPLSAAELLELSCYERACRLPAGPYPEPSQMKRMAALRARKAL